MYGVTWKFCKHNSKVSHGLETNHSLWAAPAGSNTIFGPQMQAFQACDRRDAVNVSQEKNMLICFLTIWTCMQSHDKKSDQTVPWPCICNYRQLFTRSLSPRMTRYCWQSHQMCSHLHYIRGLQLYRACFIKRQHLSYVMLTFVAYTFIELILLNDTAWIMK